MCRSTVYASEDESRAVMEYVSKIDIDGDQITLTDVMGVKKTVTGKLLMADLNSYFVKTYFCSRSMASFTRLCGNARLMRRE